MIRAKSLACPEGFESPNPLTANPVTIDAETPISVAATKMLMNRFNSLPVVEENGRVLGIITSTDVLSSSEKMVKELMHLRQR